MQTEQQYIKEIKLALKKVGLKSNLSIKKSTDYPNTYQTVYNNWGYLSIKSFSDVEKLTGCWITFAPHQNNEILLNFNFK